MALPETAPTSAPPAEAALDEQSTAASGMRLKVATRPAAVGATWLELFHPGSPSQLTLDARVRVIADVTGALIQIHENAGIPRAHRRHGRLTPRHVLITVDGSACLFHVKEPFSRLLPPQPDLGYLAPELLTQSASANQQCDVFSLGVLLWEALDNGRLFPHRRAAAISRLSSRSLPAPRASEEWALPLCDVALRALAHDPAERFADATAFWLALREHLPPPDAARAALSRLAQQALKLELTSEIRDVPPYLVQSPLSSSSRPPGSLESAVLEPGAARYSLHPEPSSRRLNLSSPSAIPGAPNPAWILSDPPPTSVRPSSEPAHSSRPAAETSEQPRTSSAASEQPRTGAATSERPRASSESADKPRSTRLSAAPATARSPSLEPPISSLRVNLQRELGDSSLPFFVASQPAPRPFPWGALSFAALIFFGVGAAVAFGAVSALRASRTDVVVRERTLVEAAAEGGGPSPRSAAPTAAAVEAPNPRALASPAAPTPAAAPVPRPPAASASKPAEPRSESRRAPRRPSKARPRPMPVRSQAPEPPKEAEPAAPDSAKQGIESLPFTSQPY